MESPDIRNPNRAAYTGKESSISYLFPDSVRFVLLFGCLLILALLAFLALRLGIPAWAVRITGTQTAGIAQEIASCGADNYSTQGDNAVTSSFAFKFVDAHGQSYNVTSHSFCNNLYNNGEHITLWYLPNDPHSILTDQEAFWLYLLTAIWLPITGVILRFTWLLTRPLLLSRWHRRPF